MDITSEKSFSELYPRINPFSDINTATGASFITNIPSGLITTAPRAGPVGDIATGVMNDCIYVYETGSVCYYQILRNGIKVGNPIKLPGTEVGAIVPGQVANMFHPVVKSGGSGWLIVASYSIGNVATSTNKGVVYWMTDAFSINFDRINGVYNLSSEPNHAVRKYIFWYTFRWLVLLDTGNAGYFTINNMNANHSELVKLPTQRHMANATTFNYILYIAYVNNSNLREISIDRFSVNDLLNGFSLTMGLSISPPVVGGTNTNPALAVYRNNLLCTYGGGDAYYSVAIVNRPDLPVTWSPSYRFALYTANTSTLATNYDAGVTIFAYHNTRMTVAPNGNYSNICYKIFYWSTRKWSVIEYVFTAKVPTGKISCAYGAGKWFIQLRANYIERTNGTSTTLLTVVVPFKLLRVE